MAEGSGKMIQPCIGKVQLRLYIRSATPLCQSTQFPGADSYNFHSWHLQSKPLCTFFPSSQSAVFGPHCFHRKFGVGEVLMIGFQKKKGKKMVNHYPATNIRGKLQKLLIKTHLAPHSHCWVESFLHSFRAWSVVLQCLILFDKLFQFSLMKVLTSGNCHRLIHLVFCLYCMPIQTTNCPNPYIQSWNFETSRVTPSAFS